MHICQSNQWQNIQTEEVGVKWSESLHDVSDAYASASDTLES